MAQIAASTVGRPTWIDLASSDPAASRSFYAGLFEWDVQVNPDPQYGGYALARAGGHDVAGIGPKMMAEAPTAWSLYVGTDDVDALAQRVAGAGGKIVVSPMEVGDQGRMAVFADPAGAIISAWQARAMSGFTTGAPGAFGWAELNARGLPAAIPFYAAVFGWTTRTSPMGEGQPPYTEFLLGEDSIAGAMEMNPAAPPSMPSYWMVYFLVDDVDARYRKAIALGAQEVVSPTNYPGGRFAIFRDPQGASFGLLKV
jgi:predicted enzyme related to lactoylglutathione lyase